MSQFNEPWTVERNGESPPRCIIGKADGSSLPPPYCPRFTEKDAARIIACVNALAGVPTEDIERVVELGKAIILQRAAMMTPMPEGFAERILGFKLDGIEGLLRDADSPEDLE